MKKKIGMVLTLLLFSTSIVLAHPGRRDVNGCHTCKTNCEKYGLSYGEYHCHDGSSSSSSKKTTSSSSSTLNKTTVVKKSSDKTLKSLKIDGQTIDLTSKLEYVTKEENVTIYAEANDHNAKLDYDEKVELNIGENKVKIKVTAEDASTKTYIITIIREEEVIPVISENIVETGDEVVQTNEDDSTVGGIIATAGIGGLGYLGYKKYKKN